MWNLNWTFSLEFEVHASLQNNPASFLSWHQTWGFSFSQICSSLLHQARERECLPITYLTSYIDNWFNSHTSFSKLSPLPKVTHSVSYTSGFQSKPIYFQSLWSLPPPAVLPILNMFFPLVILPSFSTTGILLMDKRIGITVHRHTHTHRKTNPTKQEQSLLSQPKRSHMLIWVILKIMGEQRWNISKLSFQILRCTMLSTINLFSKNVSK